MKTFDIIEIKLVLKESLASSLVFDWKPNWFLSRKLFLCGESSFGLSILRGSWHRSVHLLHLIHLFLFFYSCVLWRSTMLFLNLHPKWSKSRVHGLDCITFQVPLVIGELHLHLNEVCIKFWPPPFLSFCFIFYNLPASCSRPLWFPLLLGLSSSLQGTSSFHHVFCFWFCHGYEWKWFWGFLFSYPWWNKRSFQSMIPQ